jgi:hypothetical protein
MVAGRHGEGPTGGISLGVGQVEGAEGGETVRVGQVEGPMGGHSKGAGLVEGLLEGEKLGEGRVGEPSKGPSEGERRADGAVEGDSEGVRTATATRRRRRLRQHQRQAKQKKYHLKEGDPNKQEQQKTVIPQKEVQDMRELVEDESYQAWPGLRPPTLANGLRVNGDNKRQLKRENKAKRIKKQINQEPVSHWATHQGTFRLPPELQGLDEWEGQMCPSGLALHHPAAATLLEYATGGCPTNTGNPWTNQQMQEAINRGPHVSALDPEAIAQMAEEVADKVRIG